MDDAEKMDLVLNSDFDPSLLDCWDSNATANGKNETKGSGDTSMSQSPRSNNSAGGNVSWDSNSAPGFARLPNFSRELNGKSTVEGATSTNNALNNNTSVAAAAAGHQPWHTSTCTQQVSSTTQSPVPPGEAGSISNEGGTRKNSPVSVSTTASVASATATRGGLLSQNKNANQTTTSETSNTTQMHPLAIPSSANCPPHVVTAAHQAVPAQMQTVAGMQNALFPMALSTLGGNAAAAFAAAGLSFPAPHLNSSQPNNNPNPLQEQQQQQQQQQQQALNSINPLFFTSQSMGLQSNLQQSNSTASPPPGQQHHAQSQAHQQQSTHNSGSNKATSQSTSPPPFYLFDAPVELRVNFMQSQRMHGLPVTEDSNSYHYGVAVNGFHPQLNAQLNPANMASSSGGGHHSSSVQLVDARHSNRKAGRIKNEREQRRAQKITELIDQLREKMETGGWKVEVKSKFHTLSSCADYVKHLIQKTKEKEEAVNKAKSDLQMKEHKVEEEKALQESRSDPESVMSSLTSSTGDSGTSTNASNNHHASMKVSSENSSSEEGQRKRKSSSDGTSSNKKSRRTNHSGPSESSGEESQRLIRESLDKTTSSVSDITDSNKGSSNSGCDTQNSNQRSDDDDASGTPSSVSASSSAAVAQARDGKKPRRKHADVVIKERSTDGKHKFPTEITSLEESFVLDYEEVFVRSNVPQIVATTAGRIIAWNDFFLKATGISKAGVKQGLTIFSLVKQDKLSNLFEIVAKALKKDVTPTSSDSPSNCVESAELDYATMTLPCIEFPSSKDKLGKGKELANPLYVTVTLMADEDPSKRLFHCVFTDCPGTNGALGSITPELLSMLFTRHRKVESSDARKGDKMNKKTSRCVRT